MASEDKPTYQPQDAISSSVNSTMIMGGTGLFLSAIQNTLTRQNNVTAAIGGTYEFARTASANLREKNDAYNNAIGGFLGGSVVGLRYRSFPAVIGFGAALSVLQFAFEFTGGKFTGYAQDPEVDEYERKEQLRRNRRRPIEQTLQELGEGRGRFHPNQLAAETELTMTGVYGPGYQERRRERLKQHYGIDVPATLPPASP
ncbi:MAG: hypothetical protein Q9218_001295 [Villophora microphyllina]